MKVKMDFKKISEETGVRKGQIFYSPTFKSFVVSGHPDIDLICIEPPTEILDNLNGKKISDVFIKDNHWTLTKE